MCGGHEWKEPELWCIDGASNIKVSELFSRRLGLECSIGDEQL
jgi:hypothetical protein